jgi:hypothetical protein
MSKSGKYKKKTKADEAQEGFEQSLWLETRPQGP